MSQQELREHARAQLLRARPGRLFQAAARATADKEVLAKRRTLDQVGEPTDLPSEEAEKPRA